MPLRCVDEHGETIEASACNEEEWKALRARSRTEHLLRMPCCTARAVLKTSRLGTRFFAHKARGACTYKTETAVHLYLKALALNAARDAGWEAETESSGSVPGGEPWTADVLAWRAGEKIAVEIQWSGQTNEQTERRQERYRRSGVKGVWLLRQPGFPISEDLPAACIGGSLEEGLKILIPKEEGLGAWHRKEDRCWTQVLAPEAFLAALFEKRFRFGIDHAMRAKMSIETGVLDCWKCGTPTRIVTWLVARVGPHEIRETLELADEVPGLAELIRNALGHREDMGAVRERYSRTVGGSYVSNGCARCDALIGRFFEHDAWDCDNETVGEIEWPLDAEGKAMLAAGLRRIERLDELQRWGVWEHAGG